MFLHPERVVGGRAGEKGNPVKSLRTGQVWYGAVDLGLGHRAGLQAAQLQMAALCQQPWDTTSVASRRRETFGWCLILNVAEYLPQNNSPEPEGADEVRRGQEEVKGSCGK